MAGRDRGGAFSRGQPSDGTYISTMVPSALTAEHHRGWTMTRNLHKQSMSFVKGGSLRGNEQKDNDEGDVESTTSEEDEEAVPIGTGPTDTAPPLPSPSEITCAAEEGMAYTVENESSDDTRPIPEVQHGFIVDLDGDPTLKVPDLETAPFEIGPAQDHPAAFEVVDESTATYEPSQRPVIRDDPIKLPGAAENGSGIRVKRIRGKRNRGKRRRKNLQSQPEEDAAVEDYISNLRMQDGNDKGGDDVTLEAQNTAVQKSWTDIGVERVITTDEENSRVLVKWAGFDTDEASWIDADDLEESRLAIVENCDHYLDDHHVGISQVSEESTSGSDAEISNDSLLASELDETLLAEIHPSSSGLDSRNHALEDELDAIVFGESVARPFLGATRKWRQGAKKALAAAKDLGLSDSDLENTLEEAWLRDRDKKKARKALRQQQRKEGMVSRKAKSSGVRNAQQKFPDGMTIHELLDEFRHFLLNDDIQRYYIFLFESANPSLPMPPMPHYSRKIMHEIASLFKITSKSQGAGNYRFVVLNKTTRSTLSLQEDEMDELLNRRKLFFRLGKSLEMGGPEEDQGDEKRDKKKVESSKQLGGSMKEGRAGKKLGGSRKEGKACKKRGESTKESKASKTDGGVKLREGEVVGSDAPEIGTDNKGHAMLAKMGWTQGTGLGARRSGIRIAIEARVKHTKSGLA